jgi:hypothetical protein
MSKTFKVQHRVRIENDDLAFYSELEKMEDKVWISSTCRCERYSLIGVPSNKIDILIEEDLLFPACLEIGSKEGRYDGNYRTRLTFRSIHPGMIMDEAALLWERGRNFMFYLFVKGEKIWTGNYAQLRWEADGPEVIRQCLGWHCSRYYKHLFEEGDSLLDSLAALIHLEHPDGWKRPLASINRLVSRYLYRESRHLGWRKLTKREGALYMMASCGWVRQSSLDCRAACHDLDTMLPDEF